MVKRILVALPHFFKPSKNPTHGYNDGKQRDNRLATIRRSILNWRSVVASPSADLVMKDKLFELREPRYHVDFVYVTDGVNSIVDATFARENGIEIEGVDLPDPRYLGYEAHRVLHDRKDRYDYFVYSEDDLLVEDVDLIRKITFFSNENGPLKVLFPNRYEINVNGPAYKTYIDGQITDATLARIRAFTQAEDAIVSHVYGDRIEFFKARNPHSGFFLLNREQLDILAASTTFLDKDASFVSPLESASSLAIAKVFTVYKSERNSLDYCTIRHATPMYSNLKLPLRYV